LFQKKGLSPKRRFDFGTPARALRLEASFKRAQQHLSTQQGEIQ
jgi:hypothetical protein